MAEEESKSKKVKLPTAQKRMIQNVKRQNENRLVRSKIRTACRHLNEKLESNNAENLPLDLKKVYSLVDKAVKTNVYKANQAKRIKSHYAKRVQKSATVS